MMIRPRATTPLHRLAGEGIRSTLRSKNRLMPAVVSKTAGATATRAVVSMHTGAVSTHGHGSNPTRRVDSRITSRWLDMSLPLAQLEQQRWRSCCFVGDNSRAATGGVGSATAAAAAAATAAAKRTTSTSAASKKNERKHAQEPSTAVGAETANGITFETGKVSLACYRPQQHTHARSGTGACMWLLLW